MKDRGRANGRREREMSCSIYNNYIYVIGSEKTTLMAHGCIIE